MKPLDYDLTDSALAELSAAGEGVRAYQGDDAAEAFSLRIYEAIIQLTTRLAQEVADNESGKPFQLVDEASSVKWAKPIYRHEIETAKKRWRGSSAGLWYMYYSLRDKTGVGEPDTLLIHGLRHSAGRPIDWEE